MPESKLTAREFAIKAHGDQRYGNLPYEAHLHDVRMVIIRFALNLANGTLSDLLNAAWLHDVMEDTPIKLSSIIQQFGTEVARMVWAVTGIGANRKERNASAYRKIREYGLPAVILKLADRIANTEHSITHQTRHLEMYRREFPEFEAALYRAGEADAMWAHLRAISGGVRLSGLGGGS